MARWLRLHLCDQSRDDDRARAQQACTGVDPSFKILDQFDVEYKAEEDVDRFYLEGFVPDVVNDGSNTIKVFVDNELLATESVTHRFRIDVTKKLKKGDMMQIRVEASESRSPFQQGLSQDKRKISFVLLGLHFR